MDTLGNAMFQVFQEQWQCKDNNTMPHTQVNVLKWSGSYYNVQTIGHVVQPTQGPSHNKSAKPDPLIRFSLNGIMIACRGSWAGPILEIEDRWKEELEAGTGRLRARPFRVDHNSGD